MAANNRSAPWEGHENVVTSLAQQGALCINAAGQEFIQGNVTLRCIALLFLLCSFIQFGK